MIVSNLEGLRDALLNFITLILNIIFVISICAFSSQALVRFTLHIVIKMMLLWGVSLFESQSNGRRDLSNNTLAFLPLFLMNIFTALKGTMFIFYLLSLQLVLCRVAALKSGPVHRP